MTEKTTKKKRPKMPGAGRPRAKIDKVKLRALARISPKITHCAVGLNIHPDTLGAHLKKDPELRRAFDDGVADRHKDLNQKALEMALQGDARVLLHLLRNEQPDDHCRAERFIRSIRTNASLTVGPEPVEGDAAAWLAEMGVVSGNDGED